MWQHGASHDEEAITLPSAVADPPASEPKRSVGRPSLGLALSAAVIPEPARSESARHSRGFNSLVETKGSSRTSPQASGQYDGPTQGDPDGSSVGVTISPAASKRRVSAVLDSKQSSRRLFWSRLTMRCPLLALCVSSLERLRRKAAPRCRALNRSKFFQVVMLVSLMAALFLPEIWVLADRPGNTDLDVILTIVFVLFVFELAVQSIGLAKTYPFSFFFWMDLFGAGSVLIDISYVTSMDVTSSLSSTNVVIMRAARIAKLGARAGRFTKLVKLLRFLPGMKEQGTDQGTAKVISARLITALSTRVSCLIIVMVVVMPLFSMWTYPEEDWSTKSFLELMERTNTLHPDRFLWQLDQFQRFYDDKDYYMWKFDAKSRGALNQTLVSTLPWLSPRGPPNRPSNSARFASNNFVCEFNFKRPNQTDSLMNLLSMMVVMVLMVGFSLVVSNSVSAIVLRPLEKLLVQVRQMASTIFQSVTDMAVSNKDGDDEDDYDSEDGNNPSGGNTLGNETELLEKVVQKLAVLSEITLNKNLVDAETMAGLAEGDRAVIHGFQGTGNTEGPAWSQRSGSVDDDQDEGQVEAGGQLAVQRAMLEESGLSLEVLDSWGLNPLELDRTRNFAATTYCIGTHSHGIRTDPSVMQGFIEEAEAGYNKTCPYHSWFHAVDVTHAVYRYMHLCNVEEYLSKEERFALLVSAVCHDIGHPGLNNTFLIETSHELALRYNDKSPLENMHCAKLFEVVSLPRCNIFANMPKTQFQEIRKVCIDAILHTDNAQHFAMIKEVQIAYEVNSEMLDVSRSHYHASQEFPIKEVVDVFRQPDTRRMMVKLLLHMSDISNSAKPFRICRIWAWQVLEEFFMQGDEERRLGVPVQALNDREKVNRAVSQVGFIEFLVSPLLFAVARVLPPVHASAEQMVQNAKTWHNHWLTDTKPAPSEAEKKALADRVAKLEHKLHECR